MSSETGQDRVVGWNGMFVAPEDDPRKRENYRGENATLTGYLGNYRKTLELKCQNLDPAAMAARSVPPSDL